MPQTLAIHSQAEQLREEEEFEQALEAYQQAVDQYLKNEDFVQAASALQGSALTYKHLYQVTEQDNFLDLAQEMTEASLELAKLDDDEVVVANGHQLLAEIAKENGQLQQAVEHYQLVLATYQKQDGLRGRYLYHLGAIEYKLGQQQTGLEKIKKGLNLIKKQPGDYDSYTLAVWQSGALLALAKALQEDQPEQAKQYLQQAKAIIDEHGLQIRKKHYLELREEITN